MNGFFTLLQLNELTAVQRAVRDQLQKGGSALSALLMVVGLVGLVLFTYWLSRQQKRHAAPRHTNDPRKLFEGLLGKLGVNGDQRRLLHGVLRHARLKHPALVLMSDRAFDRHVNNWRERDLRTGGTGDGARDDAVVARLRILLFP